jgi:7-cyano-7-deazaguanine synthase in queuosine biosynthesis
MEYITTIAALEMELKQKVMVISFQYDQIHLKECLKVSAV